MKKTKQTAEDRLRARLIDQAGALEAELADLKKKSKLLTELKKRIVALADPYPAAQGILLDGDQYAASVSAQEYERAISDMEAVFRTLGEDLFLSLCSMTMKNLEANTTPEEIEKLVTKERTGPRTVTLLKRASAAA